MLYKLMIRYQLYQLMINKYLISQSAGTWRIRDTIEYSDTIDKAETRISNTLSAIERLLAQTRNIHQINVAKRKERIGTLGVSENKEERRRERERKGRRKREDTAKRI